MVGPSGPKRSFDRFWARKWRGLVRPSPVEAPRTIYAKRSYSADGKFTESYLGSFDTAPTEDLIRNEADTRYVLTGITVDDQEFHADVTSYTSYSN